MILLSGQIYEDSERSQGQIPGGHHILVCSTLKGLNLHRISIIFAPDAGLETTEDFCIHNNWRFVRH